MWTCEWCGRHMLDSDERWGQLGYGKYCSQRCAQESFKAEKEQQDKDYFYKNAQTCEWCKKQYLPWTTGQSFCSDACHDAWVRDENAKAAAKEAKENIPNSYISLPDKGFSWDFHSYNEVTVTYGRIVNSGNAGSGILRIAVYSALHNDSLDTWKVLLGSYNFNVGLRANEQLNEGNVKISITSPARIQQYALIAVEKYENGEWIICSYNFSGGVATEEWYKSMGWPYGSLPEGAESKLTDLYLGKELHYKMNVEDTYDVSCESIINVSNNTSGPLRIAAYYTPTDSVRDGTLWGASQPLKALQPGYQYTNIELRIELSGEFVQGNNIIICIEEQNPNGQWCPNCCKVFMNLFNT